MAFCKPIGGGKVELYGDFLDLGDQRVAVLNGQEALAVGDGTFLTREVEEIHAIQFDGLDIRTHTFYRANIIRVTPHDPGLIGPSQS